MKTYKFILLISIAAVVSITYFYKGASTVFYGIAESSEIMINSENNVEVKKILVVQGQSVQKETLLLEVYRPGLEKDLAEKESELNEIEAELALEAGVSKSQIQQLKVEQARSIETIQAKIKELEGRYQLNKELTSGLKSIRSEAAATPQDAEDSPLLREIAELKQDLQRARDPASLKIAKLKNGADPTNNPLQLKKQRVESELKVLLEEKQKLEIRSPIDGVVGSVNYKEGEKARAFSSLLTLHANSPSYIKGYIHENSFSRVDIGHKATISSLSGKRYQQKGDIVGIGSRIVEYPIRLRKRAEIQIWGREVIIKLPEDNRFLLGEKVLITLMPNLLPGNKNNPKKEHP